MLAREYMYLGRIIDGAYGGTAVEESGNARHFSLNAPCNASSSSALLSPAVARAPRVMAWLCHSLLPPLPPRCRCPAPARCMQYSASACHTLCSPPRSMSLDSPRRNRILMLFAQFVILVGDRQPHGSDDRNLRLAQHRMGSAPPLAL